MKQVIAGIAVLLAGGVVNGLLTDRWSPSPHLAAAAARLEALPGDAGAWKGTPHEQDADALSMTGAAGHYSRMFLDPVTGDKVLVILLCGKPAQMVVHKPEDCYRAAGYEMAGPALRIKVHPKGGEEAEMFTGLFGREEADGPTQMRIFWSWLGGEGWEAPAGPRFHFGGRPVLYKLYVIRNVTGTSVPVGQDPAIRLLGELLPILGRELPTP